MPWRFDRLAIEPERVRAMRGAYYKTCAELRIPPNSDRATEIIVTKIIALCTAGECDPDRLCELTVAYFRAGQAVHADA